MVFDSNTYFTTDFTVDSDCAPFSIKSVPSVFTLYVPLSAPATNPAILSSYEYFSATSDSITCPVQFTVKDEYGGDATDDWLSMNNTDMVGIIRVDSTTIKDRKVKIDGVYTTSLAPVNQESTLFTVKVECAAQTDLVQPDPWVQNLIRNASTDVVTLEDQLSWFGIS